MAGFASGGAPNLINSRRSAEFAERPDFAGQPLPRQVHASWLKARAVWLAMLDFIAGRARPPVVSARFP